MQIVVVTPPNAVPGELKQVNRLFAAGLPVLHLRKPSADAAAISNYLQGVKDEFLGRIVLHQHHDLAEHWGLKGVHFKERDRPPPPLPRHVAGLSQSTSLHTLQEVLQDWQHLDYAFLSPIFDSISKEGYAAASFDKSELQSVLKQAHMPVYALGGVSVDKVQLVKQLGFQGIGLLGAVWNQEDPVAALQEFQAALQA